jgi:fucose 4-O-acetylase-like acetyltransferase
MKERILYLDNIKIFLITYVVTGHTSVSYGGIGRGEWLFKEPTTDFVTRLVLNTYNAVGSAFIISLFFFISGYFIPASYKHKGFQRFSTDRVIKLGIPMIIYFLLISHIIKYLVGIAANGYSDNFFHYLADAWQLGDYGRIGIMWFAEVLLGFSLVYAIGRRYFPDFRLFQSIEFPKNISIFIFGILLALAGYITRIWFVRGSADIAGFHVASLFMFFSFFVLGTIAYTNQWLDKLTPRIANQWFGAILVLIFIAFILFVTGRAGVVLHGFKGRGSLMSLVFSLWEVFLCIGIIMKVIILFRAKLNNTGKFAAALARSAFVVYIIHPVFIVGVKILLLPVAIFPLLKYFLAISLIMPAVFFAAWLITRIPGVNKFV